MAIVIEAATLADRRRVYDWMTSPGIVERMMGPPDFPDSEVPSYEEFVESWVEHYWTHVSGELGRLFLIVSAGVKVGVIAHNDVVTTAAGDRASELDMWLRGPGHTGRGIGRAAIAALLPRLAQDAGVETAFLQPSARNTRAIRCYEKAGFSRVALGSEQAAAHFRTEPDYSDSVFLSQKLVESAGRDPQLPGAYQMGDV
jgi:RimJ/RimL family protein N-acetyltransferase